VCWCYPHYTTDPKPPIKEFYEGPEAAQRFDALVRKVIAVPHSEIKKRHEALEKERKRRGQKRYRYT
jgi:hypothetical protein